MNFEFILLVNLRRAFASTEDSYEMQWDDDDVNKSALKSDHNEMNILSLESRKESNKWNTIIIIFVRFAVISRANLKCILQCFLLIISIFLHPRLFRQNIISLRPPSSRLKNYTFRKDDSFCIVIFGGGKDFNMQI